MKQPKMLGHLDRNVNEMRATKNRVKLSKSVFNNKKEFRSIFNDFMAPRKTDRFDTERSNEFCLTMFSDRKKTNDDIGVSMVHKSEMESPEQLKTDEFRTLQKETSTNFESIR